MTYLQEQLFRATLVNPQGRIVPSWHLLLQKAADQDALEVWANESNSGYTLPVEGEKRSFSLRKALVGILP